VGVGAREPADVGAGAEVVADAAHHQHAHIRYGGEAATLPADLLPHLVVDRVALGGPVEPQRRHAVVDRQLDERVHHPPAAVVVSANTCRAGGPEKISLTTACNRCFASSAVIAPRVHSRSIPPSTAIN